MGQKANMAAIATKEQEERALDSWSFFTQLLKYGTIIACAITFAVVVFAL